MTPYCAECGATLKETPLYRNKPKGQVGDWRCEKHLEKKPKPDLKHLVNIIHKGRPRP